MVAVRVEKRAGKVERKGSFGELDLPSLSPSPALSSNMSDSQASSSSSSLNPLPRHDFFQSDEKFTLSIFVKGLKPEDVSVSFRERSVRPFPSLLLPRWTYQPSRKSPSNTISPLFLM